MLCGVMPSSSVSSWSLTNANDDCAVKGMVPVLEGSGQIAAPTQCRYKALNQSAQALQPAGVLTRWRPMFEVKWKHSKPY